MNKQVSILIIIVLGLLASAPARAQVAVSGRVTTAEGQPLPGLTLRVKHAQAGTLTDEQGRYQLQVPSAQDTLIFSYIGYQQQEIPLNGRQQLDVVMLEEIRSLDEVVIVGYGVQKKSDLTGAISSVKADELNKIPTASVEQALQGKVAGVQVTPTSGEPGAGAVIRIRGTGTLNDASPLYVVDGMLLDDISFLNLNDVESIEVLKDASATAIYGSRGANGVIIISTRKGQQGSTTFNFHAYYGQQQVVKKIALTNAREYATLANEVALNEGRSPSFANPDAFGEGTDWQEVIFEPAPIQNYQLSANGGSERMQYNLSADYFSQAGIIRGSQFDRATLRLNNTYQLTPSVKVGHNIALVYNTRTRAAGVLGNAYRADPTVPPIDSAGNFGNTSINAPVANPEAQIFYNHNQGFGYRTVGNLYIDLNFLKHFTFRTNLGLDLSHNQNKSFTPVFFVSAIQQNQESRLNVYTDRSRSWLWENTLTFHKTWKGHELTLLGGMTSQEFEFENLGGQRLNLPGDTEEFFYLSAGEIEGQTNFNGAFSWSMLSYLFRLNYSLNNRYLFTASFRADGSSRFGADNRYGYFPSFAAGWRISEEDFFQPFKPLISHLKLRASWGKIGNDKIGAYAGRAVVTSNLNAVFGPDEALNNGASIITLANSAIRWEETSQLNAGLELGLFDNRLLAEMDYYRRQTDDILVDVPIPAYVGAANNPVINAASVLNTGLDLKLDWRDRQAGFFYAAGIILSTVHNEVLALGEGKEEIFGGGLGVGGKLGTRTVVGLPIGAFYGYKVAGIFQNEAEIQQFPNRGVEVPGDLRFVDTDGDGRITTADRTYLGSPIPKLIYSFNFRLEYRGVEVYADFNGVEGNQLVNAKKMARFGTPNFEASFLDRWTTEGSSHTEPRITNGGHNYEMSERFLEDGSFLRLRSLQLGYSLPRQWIEKLGLKQLRFYLSGTNLITWTAYSGYTPEITSNSVIEVGIDRGVYPIAKTYSAGVNLTF
ncbi:MAG: TonB-dependent receptor [Bacteroidetes bacterium]|nr:MAG: TonB-dependent receptor [Bacteroidota bacterium]